jgi:hypothetical protein
VACSWLALLLVVQLMVTCPSPPEWLLVLHLLGLLQVACPSPPGMDLELQVLLHGFVGWCSNVFMLLCARTMVFLWCFPAGRMRAASPGCAHLAGCLVCKQLWCCQLQLPSPMTELLVCLFTSLSSISSTVGRAVKLLCTPLFCTPVNNRIDSTLGPLILSDAIGNLIAPCLRVSYTNTNPLLVFFILLF